MLIDLEQQRMNSIIANIQPLLTNYDDDIKDLIVYLRDYTSPVGIMLVLRKLYDLTLVEAKNALWEHHDTFIDKTLTQTKFA